jgi:radical SAM protein with 4Fe4S-binding SPASM domain
LSCRHCYQDSGRESLGREELDRILEGYAGFLHRLGRKGRIQFTGGEPFLSEHLFGLIRSAANRRIPVRVLSNGTLVTQEIAARLKEEGCGPVQVSLDGLRDTHDSMRGEGSFEKALSGINALREAGVETVVAMTLSQANSAEALDLARLVEAMADRIHFSRLVPMGQGRSLSGECLSSKELKRLMTSLLAFRRRARIDLPLRDPLWKALFKPPARCSLCVSGCAAGFNGLAVDADGEVYPCRRLPISMGNILEQPWREIWEAPLMQALRDRNRLKGRCGQCRLRWVCGGCRGIAYAVSGDPLAEDPQCFFREKEKLGPKQLLRSVFSRLC